MDKRNSLGTKLAVVGMLGMVGAFAWGIVSSGLLDMLP